MNDSVIQAVAVYAIPVLFAITLHEVAHGWAARYFGDDQLTIATLRPQPADPTRRARPAVAGARH